MRQGYSFFVQGAAHARQAGFWLLHLSLFAGLLFTGLAHADQFVAAPGASGSGASAWTVYGFGNAQAISDVMRAVNNFVASGTFHGIVALLAVIGVLAVGASSGFSRMIARSFVSYAAFVLFVVYLLFGFGSGPVSVMVEVEDSVDGTWTAPVAVPAVVGIPAALISGAGLALTRQVEASFPLPDSMKISNGAPFNLAATLISDEGKARIQDPNLASSFAYYVQDCFMMGAARGTIPVTTLWHSTDFLTDIDAHLQSVYVNTLLGDPVGQPKLVTCSPSSSGTGAAGGKSAIELLRDAVNSQSAADYMTGASAWANTPALSVLGNAADDVAAWVMNAPSGSGGSMVKQAAVLAAFTPAYRQAATATGNSDFLTGLAVTQAVQTQQSSWVVGAQVFNKIMGYIFAVLQVFIYALTPLILAAALIPSLGLSLLKNFGQVLLWLALWQPLLAIVNFIVLSMQRAGLGGAFATGGGGAAGWALSNMGIITERAANMSAAATFVGTMVPVLAWVFVRGTIDFSRMVGSAVGENFAQQAGSTLSTGNFSLNQGSMDSFSANKVSISPIMDAGNGLSVSGVERFGNRHNYDPVEMNDGERVGAAGSYSSGMASQKSLMDQAGRSRQVSAGTDYSNGVSLSSGGGHTETGSEASARSGASILSGSVGVGGHPLRGLVDPQKPNSARDAHGLDSQGSGQGGAADAQHAARTDDRGLVGRVMGAAVDSAKATVGAVTVGGNGTVQGVQNDTHGYQAGDSVHANFAKTEQGGQRASETASSMDSHSASGVESSTSSRSTTYTAAARDRGRYLTEVGNERDSLATALMTATTHAMGMKTWNEAMGHKAASPSSPNYDRARGVDETAKAAHDGKVTSELGAPLPGAGAVGGKLHTLEGEYGKRDGDARDAISKRKADAHKGALAALMETAPGEVVKGLAAKANDTLSMGKGEASDLWDKAKVAVGLGHGGAGKGGHSEAPAGNNAAPVQTSAAMPVVMPADPAPVSTTMAPPPPPPQLDPVTLPPAPATMPVNGLGLPGSDDPAKREQGADAGQLASLEQETHRMRRAGEGVSENLQQMRPEDMSPENKEYLEQALSKTNDLRGGR